MAFSLTAAGVWFNLYFISVTAGFINAPRVFGSSSDTDQMMFCHTQS